MSTLSGTPTLADIAKETDPNGKPAKIAELLHQKNAILDDIPWIPGNLDGNGHQVSQDASLPTPSWVGPNTGINPGHGTAVQFTEAGGILASLSEVDKHVAERGGNLQANLFNQGRRHIEGMAQEFAQTLVYGNPSTAPNEFRGFFPRYNSLSGTTAQNIVAGGGSGADNSSILLVGWGEGKVCCFYPKGSMAGLEQVNEGLQTITVTAGAGSTGSKFQGYRTYFYWKGGLAVEDWRFVVRAPNIDVSDLVGKTSAADLFDIMIKMLHSIPELENCNPVFYMNRTLYQMLDIQGRDDVISGGGLGWKEIAGKEVRTFRRVPIRKVDQMTEAEALVS